MSSPVQVLVPIKALPSAKRRLAGIFDQIERRALVLAMLADVLVAARGAGFTAGVLSPDPDVLSLAQDLGGRPLPEDPTAGSLNKALELAIAALPPQTGAVLVILGDVPLVTATEIRALADQQSRSFARSPALIVGAPDRAGHGTNGLLLCPPGVIRLHYGPDSMVAHLAAARANGVDVRVLKLPGLSLDVDTEADLRLVLAEPGETRTHRLLEQLRVRQRVSVEAAG
jgi:2-phospho-L-lactate guanylyltransferase